MLAMLVAIGVFVFSVHQILENKQKQSQIEELENNLKSARSTISNQRSIEQENVRYNELVKEIVEALASNDKEYGIGGVENAPAYTSFEILESIQNEIDGRGPEDWFNNVGRFFNERTEYFEEVPDVWPITREHIGRVTSGFGFRNSPFSGDLHFHGGVDLSAERGTPVIATADGTISGVWRNHPRFGQIVYIDHENGFQTRYAHLENISVEYQQEIEKGDILGQIGDSGQSKGVHLHYEIRKNGQPMDPVKFWLLYY